eukprot:scaffold5529_cov117-Cylindrotheca_fusiformis.AAC.1
MIRVRPWVAHLSRKNPFDSIADVCGCFNGQHITDQQRKKAINGLKFLQDCFRSMFGKTRFVSIISMVINVDSDRSELIEGTLSNIMQEFGYGYLMSLMM